MQKNVLLDKFKNIAPEENTSKDVFKIQKIRWKDDVSDSQFIRWLLKQKYNALYEILTLVDLRVRRCKINFDVYYGSVLSIKVSGQGDSIEKMIDLIKEKNFYENIKVLDTRMIKKEGYSLLLKLTKNETEAIYKDESYENRREVRENSI